MNLIVTSGVNEDSLIGSVKLIDADTTETIINLTIASQETYADTKAYTDTLSMFIYDAYVLPTIELNPGFFGLK